jgi:anaerobic nitric oxide reductase flavorubredoxin
MKPNFEIVATEKGIQMIKNFFGITEHLRPVHSGVRISLGKDKELLFEDIPNVHWFGTMAT